MKEEVQAFIKGGVWQSPTICCVVLSALSKCYHHELVNCILVSSPLTDRGPTTEELFAEVTQLVSAGMWNSNLGVFNAQDLLFTTTLPLP